MRVVLGYTEIHLKPDIQSYDQGVQTKADGSNLKSKIQHKQIAATIFTLGFLNRSVLLYDY